MARNLIKYSRMYNAQVLIILLVAIFGASGWGSYGRGHGHNHHNNNNNNNNQQMQNGTYICVPIGTCPGGPGGIDPRIVTPNQSVCPPGQAPCYTNNQFQCGIRRVSQISNNSGPATNGSFPWQVYIEDQTGFIGSGAIINQNHVLTAAHKVISNVNTPSNVKIYFGVWNPSDKINARMITANRIIINNGYTETLKNDIAVIRLSSPIIFNDIVIPICLPDQQQNFVNSRGCVVSGWGQTAFNANDAASNQRQVFVPIVDYATCRQSMAQANVNVNIYLDRDGDICAGGVAQNDACTQDGGAPLVCPDRSGRFVLAGLVIWGKGCGRSNVYGVYVNVAHYRNWIDSQIR